MADLTYANFALSTLSQQLASDGATVYITDDALFPDGYFTAVIWSSGIGTPQEDPSSEILTLIRTSAGVYSATRGEEGTASKIWAEGSLIANVVTASTMEYVYTAAGHASSATIMSDSIYGMSRNDTRLICTFSPADMEKSVTLPDIDLCEGLVFRIINRGSYTHQRIKLYPYPADEFAHTSESWIRIPFGGYAELTPVNGKWALLSINRESYSSIRIVDEDQQDISFGDGTLYVDSTFSDISLTLPGDMDYCGIPLRIYKMSDDSHKIIISGYSGDTTPVELTYQFDHAVFVMGSDGTVYMTESPSTTSTSTEGTQSNEYLYIDENTYLTGTERFIYVTCGTSNVYSYLPTHGTSPGQIVTVKKIDSGTGSANILAINSTIDGSAGYISLNNQWDYATFTSADSGWYRVG